MSDVISGGYSVRVPPLPIPNREVKPHRADGTAYKWESRSPPFSVSPPEVKTSGGLFLYVLNRSMKIWGIENNKNDVACISFVHRLSNLLHELSTS